MFFLKDIRKCNIKIATAEKVDHLLEWLGRGWFEIFIAYSFNCFLFDFLCVIYSFFFNTFQKI